VCVLVYGGGYQITIFPDSSINSHADTRIMAKTSFYGEGFSPPGGQNSYGIMKTGLRNTQ
jgi:hypothetical protein